MQLLAISSTPNVQNIADVVRNVCNATLSLLFTIALFIWGLLVNRKQAWRTDGGTAVFGCAALSLAVVSTALNFLYIHKAEEFVWLPGLMWAVVLWQSFLGWWWWVGAGSGGTFGNSGEDEGDRVEEKIRKQQKREARRKEAKEKRKANKMRAQKVLMDVARFIPGSSSSSTSAGAIGHSTSTQSRDPSSVSAMHARARASSGPDVPDHAATPTSNDEPNTITPITTNMSASTGPTLTRTTTINTIRSNTSMSSTSTVTSTSLVTSTSYTTDRLPQFLPTIVHRWYAYLRHTHNAAARVQAAERVERIRELGREREREIADVARQESVQGERVVVEGVGWGWEGFGWRRRRKNRSMSGPRRGREVERDLDRDVHGVNEMYAMGYTSRSASRRGSPEREKDSDVEVEEDEDDMYVSEVENDHELHQSRQGQREGEEEEENSRMTQSTTQPQNQYISSLPLHNPYFDSSAAASSSNEQPTQTAPMPAPVAMERPRSVWWWGPLWRWRLQDSTVYK